MSGEREQDVRARVEVLERELERTRQELRALAARRGARLVARSAAGFAVLVLAGALLWAGPPVQYGSPAPAMPPLIQFGTPVPSPTPGQARPAKAGPRAEGTTVQAPFRVVDGAGGTIALIDVSASGENQGLNVYDSSGNPVIQLATHSSFGQPAVVVTGGGRGVVGMGIDGQGDGYLRLTRSGGSAVIGSLGTAGLIVHNAAGTAVGQLAGVSPSGKPTGYLSLGNSGGSALVEAGALSDGFGVVRTYPQGGAPPIPIPNFIVGHGWAQQGGGGGGH